MNELNLEQYTNIGVDYKINNTPSFGFYTFYFNAKNKKIEITIRNFSKFEENGLLELINYLKEKEITTNFNKINNVSFKNLEFNSLIVYQNNFEDSTETDVSKYTAFPIYECEFSGNESGNELSFLRRNMITTINWRRKPSPIVKMKFKNLSTGVKSTGNKFNYFSKSDFFNEIKSLRKTGSFIEVKNYKNEHCKIIIEGNKILLEQKKEKKNFTKKELIVFFADFFD
ncbi:hypothetical protein [Lacinutrix sp. MEBiC02404]